MEPILDKIGQEIKVGSFVAYGHLLGRVAGLRIGKVLKLETKLVDYKPIAIETVYKIHVWGIDNEFWSDRPKILTKRSILNFPDRIIVLPDIPNNLKNLLEGLEFDTKLIECDHCKGKGYFCDPNYRSCPKCLGVRKVKP